MTGKTTYCLVCRREPSVLLALLCGVTCLEYESQYVAWRNDWLFAGVIRGIFLATKLPQDPLMVENLKNVKSKKDIIIDHNCD